MKLMTSKEAVALIKDGATVAVDGFIGADVPEEILVALENRFVETKSPSDLTLVYAAGVGDSKDRGMNHLAYEGLIKRVIGGHWGLAPKLAKLAIENKIEAYNLPQGVITHMYRDIASHRPATISTIGMHTYVDPDIEGGKVNAMTTKDIVSKIKVAGKECLCYELFPIDVAIVRGTYSDKNGNISLEKEALTLEVLSVAMAAKNSGGIVIAQVESVVDNGKLDPKMVKIPGIMVDYVVVASDPKYQMQTFSEAFNPTYITNDPSVQSTFTPMAMSARKIIARRSAMVLDKTKRYVNYGIGMPEGVPSVLHEEGVEEYFFPTVEPGAIGGTPVGGLSFGAAISPEAIIDQPYQFDFYDGGGLDIAFLGLAQCDTYGNINVSKFGTQLAGCGGFINITQSAKEVVFCGTFTAGGLKVEYKDDKLVILQEGRSVKFIKNVEQVTFSGKMAGIVKTPVTYVTERAVFVLKDGGLELTEIAPGIDMETQVFAHMEFRPSVAKDLKIMDARLFKDALMQLKF